MSISAYETLNQMQNNTNAVHFQNGRKNLGTGRMDREGFIRLIMAQLQFQDPTAPQDNSQMLMQQLALEQADQMREVVNTNKFSQAATMIGKQAELVDARWDFTNGVSSTPEWDVQTNTPKIINGTIESVVFDHNKGKALVKVNGNYYDADIIQQLSLAPTPTLAPAPAPESTPEPAPAEP